MQQDVLALIGSDSPRFSKGQKRIAAFILEHYDKAAFMTASKLGLTVGVSESTVVRFACALGFEGYPELQRDLQRIIRNKLTSVQRIEVTSERIGTADVLDKVLNSDIEKIRRTLEETARPDFSRAVETLTAARTIYILGARSASALASFLFYYFNLIFPAVRLVDSGSGDGIAEQLMRVSQGDVIIGISFPRYSKRTVRACAIAKEMGAKVLALTDGPASPLAAQADCLLTARSDMASFVDSLVAPLSLINALIVAVGLEKRDEISDVFEKLEGIWDRYEVYEKNDQTAPDGETEDE